MYIELHSLFFSFCNIVTMQKQNVLVSLVLCLAMKFVFNCKIKKMQAITNSNDLSILLMVFLALEDDSRPQIWSLHRHSRQKGF